MKRSHRADTEIIDPTGRRRREIVRRFWRIALPIMAVTMVVGAIAGVGWRSYHIVRVSVTRLSHAVLLATQNSIAQEVSTYLIPATQGQAIGLDMVQHGALSPNGGAGEATPRNDTAPAANSFQRFAIALMRQDPQVAAFYLANSDGDFELVQRATGGLTDTIVVTDKTPGQKRLLTETRTDEHGKATVVPPAISTYDPRTSAYYRGAMRQPVDGGAASVLADGSTVYWSTPYLFTPTGQPVITASIGYTDPGDSRDHVLAVNIALDQMSKFLAGLKLGENGRAMILSRDGQIIAAPQLANAHDDPKVWRFDHGITDPRLTGSGDLLRAFDLFRVNGFGPQAFTIHGTRYISLAARLPGASPDWVLLLSVPARDFAAFSASDTRSTLLSLSLIMLLAAGLASVLIWQGLRSDRLLGRLRRRNMRGRDERAALRAMLSESHLLDPSVEAPILTERLAEITGAARASIWRITEDGRALHCEDVYDARRDTHGGGTQLRLDQRTDFADARLHDTGFVIRDAETDPHTRHYWQQAMRPAGTRALEIVPVACPEQEDDGEIALLLIEDPTRTDETEGLVEMIAGIVGLRIQAEVEGRSAKAESGSDVSLAPPPQSASAPGPTEIDRDLHGDNLLLDPGADGDAPPAGLYPAVGVLVLTFGDSGADPAGSTRDIVTLVREMAGGFQQIARQYGLFSLKVAGHRLVAAAGCTAQPDPDAAIRLGQAAIAMRDLCLARLGSAETDPAFEIGIDVGPTYGAELGEAPSVFNLWGETVRIAEMMAQSNPQPGTIQVTEAMYQLLRERFLFRARGSFYTPRGGVSRAYILAGRQ